MQALVAEEQARTGTGGVVGRSESGRPIVARGPSPRTVTPREGDLERGAARGLWEVIG